MGGEREGISLFARRPAEWRDKQQLPCLKTQSCTLQYCICFFSWACRATDEEICDVWCLVYMNIYFYFVRFLVFHEDVFIVP